jgi:hypothetical protein
MTSAPVKYLVRPEGYTFIEAEYDREDAALAHARRTAQENRHNYIILRPDGSKLRVRHAVEAQHARPNSR